MRDSALDKRIEKVATPWHRLSRTHTGMLQQPHEPSAEMVADITARLGRVCQDYSAEDFTDLVRQIAVIRTKYDARRAESFFEAARSLAAERLAVRRPPDDRIGGEAR